MSNLCRLLLAASITPVALGSLACGDDSISESASETGITSSQLPSEGSASASASASTSSSSTAETDTDGSSSTGATTGATDTTGEALVDDAELVQMTLPDALACGAALAAELTLRNSGTTTWSQAQGYALGAVDGSDPLAGDVRVDLPADLEIAPGDSHTFTLDLVAPELEAEYHTDWQMLRGDAEAWFGDLAEADVNVACPEDPPPDLDQVIWLHTNVSAWEETMTLESVTFQGSQICLNHSSQDEGVFVWPEKEYSPGTWVVGNPWIFIEKDGQWYAGTWEWLRPDQTCKAITSVAGDHIKVAPFDANSGWKPTSGETYYFMVSGLARQLNAVKNVQERSNLVKLVWP